MRFCGFLRLQRGAAEMPPHVHVFRPSGLSIGLLHQLDVVPGQLRVGLRGLHIRRLSHSHCDGRRRYIAALRVVEEWHLHGAMHVVVAVSINGVLWILPSHLRGSSELRSKRQLVHAQVFELHNGGDVLQLLPMPVQLDSGSMHDTVHRVQRPRVVRCA